MKAKELTTKQEDFLLELWREVDKESIETLKLIGVFK